MSIKEAGQLTVYFDDPFWVGVFESVCNEEIKTCRVVFGSEPKGYDIYEFILSKYTSLRFSRPIPFEEGKIEKKKINPKRMQRLISRQTKKIGIGTKAQQSLKKEYELNKKSHKKDSKEKKEAEKRLKYHIKQEKKKSKKRGH